MRAEHGREGGGCDDDTSALAGHLKGRRSRAVTAEVAVAEATCCANSHRLLGITQYSCNFEYLLTPRQRANRTCIENVPANLCAWPATYRSVCFIRSGNTSIKNKMANATRRNFNI